MLARLRASACCIQHVSGVIAGLEATINFDKVTDSIIVGSCLRNAADAET